ncbi:hypothetical protein Tco_0992248 [Tanacetum coccineum]|uniref:Uncharacterized protein n=1 Tax=Tanacetum coccineum TaxID=301880 RepID=A0ABQ5F200_9ASTR
MEILPVSTSNNTAVVSQPALRCPIKRTSKYDESNASALEDLTLRVGNLVKEVLIMNLPDHREIASLDEEEEIARFQDKYDHVGQKHMMIKNVKS